MVCLASFLLLGLSLAPALAGGLRGRDAGRVLRFRAALVAGAERGFGAVELHVSSTVNASERPRSDEFEELELAHRSAFGSPVCGGGGVAESKA